MSKNKNQPETAPVPVITEKMSRAEMLGYKISAADFDSAAGENHSGIKILKLLPGEAAGPFTHKAILAAQDLNVGGKKKMKPVDVYVATAPDGSEIRMPVAAGFVSKMKDAAIEVGETYIVRRAEDYVSKTYGTKGAAYEIKITSRNHAPSKSNK